MEKIMLFYVVLYMIVGLVIYHSIFEIWYINLGKALIAELFAALIFGSIMAGVTLKFWWIALIIIVIIGLALSAKVQNPTGKKIVLGVFIAVAVITAISGINYNKQQNEKEQSSSQQEMVNTERPVQQNQNNSRQNNEININNSNNGSRAVIGNNNGFGNTSDSEVHLKDSNQQFSNRDFIFSNSSTEYLTEKDLEQLSAKELTYARNEVYARHGYVFEVEELKEYFNSKSWYSPGRDNSGITINNIEEANVRLIKEYQETHSMTYAPWKEN